MLGGKGGLRVAPSNADRVAGIMAGHWCSIADVV